MSAKSRCLSDFESRSVALFADFTRNSCARPAGPERIRQSLNPAGTNTNGEFTQAQAQRPRTLPRSFEDMAENKDGVRTRAESQRAIPR